MNGPQSLSEMAQLSPFNIGQGVRHDSGIAYNKETGQIYTPEFFTYTAEWNDINGAGYNQSQNIAVQSDAEFLWLYGTYYFFDQANPGFTAINASPVPNMNIQITDSGSNRTFAQTPVAINSIFGTGRRPFELPGGGKKFAANSTIQLLLSSFATQTFAITATLQVSLIGQKHYYQNRYIQDIYPEMAGQFLTR